jgi:hypothetical protein
MASAIATNSVSSITVGRSELASSFGVSQLKIAKLNISVKNIF